MADTQTQEQPVAGTQTSQEFSFFFRTDKVRDDEGKVIGTGRKHPDVKAVLPVPTYAELGAMLAAGGKEAALIFESVVAMIDQAARNQINEFRESKGLEANFTPTDFDISKLTLTAIAYTPKAERGGPAISDEDWTAFLEDYTHVMTKTVGYDAGKVKLHVMHLKVQLRRVKNDKASVQKLLDLLNVWAAHSESLEDHQACFESLTNKANRYLKAEDKNTADAL